MLAFDIILWLLVIILIPVALVAATVIIITVVLVIIGIPALIIEMLVSANDKMEKDLKIKVSKKKKTKE